MKTILPLNGGINKDAYPLYVDTEKGQVVDRRNGRVFSIEGGRFGVNTSIKSMSQVDMNLSVDGTNTIIGYVEDKERDRGVMFVYNSTGNDTIAVFNGSTVYDMVFGSSVLNFNVNYPVDAEIIGDYCIFTDNYNPPRKIKIYDASATNGVPTATTWDAYDIQLAVRPPVNAPSVVVASDDTKVVNKLVGKTFQFAHMYVYDDYTYSVLSPYSDLVVSGSIFSADSNTFTDNNVGNYVQVTYDLGTDNVSTVKLLAREGNSGPWFIVEEYDKDGETEYQQRTINFYNDVAREGLVETEAVQYYSDVPRLAKTVAVVENRAVLANVTKGYDKTDIPFTLEVEYDDVNVSGSTSSVDATEGFDSDYYYVDFQIPATPVAGQVIAISSRGAYTATLDGLFTLFFEWSYNHTITVDTGDTQDTIATEFAYDIISKEDSIVTNVYFPEPPAAFNVVIDAENRGSGVVRLYFIGAHNALWTELPGLYGFVTQETLPSGVATYKSGSWYDVGIIANDEFGRTSGVLSKQSIYIPHAGERAFANAFDRARIKFTLPSATEGVASWMKTYRFVVSESINFSGVYPFVIGGSGTNIRDIYLDGQAVLAINMPTNFNYEFFKGDYLHIDVLDNETTPTEISSTITKMIIGTRTLLDIGGTEYSGFWLIVPKGDEAISTYDGKLAYIYRQKDTVADVVFYEDSQTYLISSGSMQTLAGYVGDGDAWYTQRTFNWSGAAAEVSKTVEDFYLNVDSALRAYSKGRATVEFDTLGEITLQDVVWSFNYLDNTKINGLSTFNSLNRKQMDEKDGQIQRIRLVGDVLKVLQDNKETSLYIGKTQFRDGAGALSVVRTNDFIGDAYPSADDYGTRYPQSVVVNGRDMYYWDGDKGEVVRSSPNGQFPISSYGMVSEFQRLKAAMAAYSGSKVIAFFDRKNKEYVITFKMGSSSETIAFKEGDDMWSSYYDYIYQSDAPDLYGTIGTLSFAFKRYLWKMESGTAYNVFFGSYKPFSVKGVVNIYPNEEKCLRAIQIDSNRGIDTEITSPIANTRPYGQKSLLYKETYFDREGNYTSAVFKNIIGAGGADVLSMIHSGDDMVGKYLEIEFTDDTSTELQLRLVTVNFTVNK